MLRLVACVWLAMVGTSFADSPEVTKWTAKLADPREAERAITELEKLGDPAAIPALGEAWVRDRSTRPLAVAITIARAKSAWEPALPYLVRATAELDGTNPKSVEAAVRAAEALGDTKLAAAVPPLADLVRRAPTKTVIGAQIAGAKALGKLDIAKAKASLALQQAIGRAIPSDPKAEGTMVTIALVGASINALGALRDPDSAPALIVAMYRAPMLFTQARRAIVALGPRAAKELRDVLADKQPVVKAAFAKDKLGVDCSAGPKSCKPIGNREYYAAILLGDLRDATAVPALLAIVARPGQPAFYYEGTASPNTQHNAAFDALRKIAAPATAAKLLAIVTNPKADLSDRVLAASAYGFVATDPAGVATLAKIWNDNTGQDELRMATAESYARLARDVRDIEPLLVLAKKYLDEAAKHTDRRRADYTAFARMFQMHVARIGIATVCKADAKCYASTLDGTTVQPTWDKYLVDWKAWTAGEKAGLLDAARERAMLELAKQGPTAAAHVDALIDAIEKQSQIVREAILLAVAKIAPTPCPSCDPKLDALLAKLAGRTTDSAFVFEATIVRNYLATR